MTLLRANAGFGYIGDDDDDAAGGTVPTAFNAMPSWTPITVYDSDAVVFTVTTSFSGSAQANGSFYVSIDQGTAGGGVTPEVTSAAGWSSDGWTYDGTNFRWYTHMTKTSVTAGDTLTFTAYPLAADDGVSSNSCRILTYLDSTTPHTDTASGSGGYIEFTVYSKSFEATTTSPAYVVYTGHFTWAVSIVVAGAQINGHVQLFADASTDDVQGGSSSVAGSFTTLSLDTWSESGWTLETRSGLYGWWNLLTKSSITSGTYSLTFQGTCRAEVGDDGPIPTTCWLSTNQVDDPPHSQNFSGVGNDFYAVFI